MVTASRRRGGFTLVEMLVVVAIIGLLAAILIPTLYRAFGKGKETVIAEDMNQIYQAIEGYRQKHQDYFPDFSNIGTPQGQALIMRHLRHCFPRTSDAFANTNMTLPDGTLANTGGATPTPFDVTTLDPSEAIPFWLGMIKKDARLPLNGNGELDKAYDFDKTRLRDIDGDGWPSYMPPDGGDSPYIYFDSRTYVTTGYYDTAGTLLVLPYQERLNATATPGWADPTKFQLISAGLDGDYGASVVNTYKIFPDRSTMTQEDLDNIATFSDGKTFEDHME